LRFQIVSLSFGLVWLGACASVEEAVPVGVNAKRSRDLSFDFVDLGGGRPGASSVEAPPDLAGAPPDAEAADLSPLPDLSPPPDLSSSCTPLPSTGTLALTGSLTSSSPTWQLPWLNGGYTCPTPAVSKASDLPYQVFVFCNNGAARSFDFALDGSDAGNYTLSDPYLVLYSGSGIPADPLACLDGNDDRSSRSYSSLVSSRQIGAGAQVTVVASSSLGTGASYYGTYRLRIVAR
jgi:hypothetical protein